MKKVLHYWDWVQGSRNVEWPSYESVLPTTEPPVAPMDLALLNQTYRVDDEMYMIDYRTQQSFTWTERWHARLGCVNRGCLTRARLA